MESLHQLLALAVLGVLVSSLGVSQAFAAEIKYEPNGVQVRNNPTICSIKPLDPDLTQNQIDKFVEQSKVSISEWENHLKDAAGKKDWSKWEFNYKQLDYANLDSDSLSGCDVVLIFSKTPPSLDFWGILGLAMSNYETGKTIIEIYYLTPQLCESGERVKDPRENIIWVFQVPCYGDMMVSDNLGGAIRHELGHALGLGHYMSTDENITLQWNQGLSPTPSIMVQSSVENSDELRIAPRDIDMLRSIYGDDGFILNSEEEKNLTLVDPNLTEQKYVSFENNSFGFKIDYPEKWFVDDSILENKDQSRLLYITEEKDDLNRTLTVGISDKSVIAGSNEQTVLNSLIDQEKNHCKTMSIEKNNISCENFALLDSKIQNNAKDKVYTIKYFWNDGSRYHVTHKNHIISGDRTWEITAEGILTPYLLSKDVMEHSLYSFSHDDFVPKSTETLSSSDNVISTNPTQLEKEPLTATQIPDWVRGNAEWWAQDAIGDSDFVSGIQYLIKEGIMTIPETARGESSGAKEIPSWIKNNAGWWAQGLISDDDFVKGIQFLIENGIMEI